MGKRNYIDNKRFEVLIGEYVEGNLDNEEELFLMFSKLIETIFDSFKFDVERDDAIQECHLLVLKTLVNFNPSNGSAFNYFSTVIINNLKLIYTKTKKRNTRHSEYIDWYKHQSDI